MQDMDDDCLRVVLSKLPRLDDMRSFTDAIVRKDLFAPAVVDRIECGSFILVESWCHLCNISRTEHGRPCRGCMHKQSIADREEEESEEDDYEDESSDDSSQDDPTWIPGQP